MQFHRTCSFSLSHLTQFKQSELSTTCAFFQSAGQHYIQALAQQTPNLVLHNRSVPKAQQILKLHGNTKGLYSPEHISSRWLSKIAKQAYETLLSVDAKQIEQAYVKTHSKRKSSLPQAISVPNLDGTLITLQFSTDNPMLLAKYPPYTITEQKVTNKKGGLVTKKTKTLNSVGAFSSTQWEQLFGLKTFDMVVRLSRIRGKQIKKGKSILILPLKQHAHFQHWLTQPNMTLLPSVVLHQTKLRKPTKGKPLSKKEVNNQFNLHLCFESDSQLLPAPEAVINLSGRACPSIGAYSVTSAQSAQTALKKALQSIDPKSVYGLDVGHCKLGVLTNHDKDQVLQQDKAYFIGTDHPERMTQKAKVLSKYKKAVNLNKKKPVSALSVNVPFKRQMLTEQSQDRLYITTTLKKMFEQIQSSDQPMKVLVMENLNKIKIGSVDKQSLGKRFNKRNALWLVRQVQSWVVHYCQQNGILCVLVDPRFTSKQCPLCSRVPELFKKGSNRSGESYTCCCCQGQTLDADYVGAYNIRQRLFFWMKHGAMPFPSSKRQLEVKSGSSRKELKQNSGSTAPSSVESHTSQ